MPRVNPDLLKWARETAGLSLDDAAKKIGVNPGRLEAIERGEREPSHKNLDAMAKKYRRPLVAFYLASPPPRGNRGEDFRRATDAGVPEFDPRLDALIRNVRARHDVVRSLLEDEEAEPLCFVGSRTIQSGVATLARSIASTIGFELARFRAAKDAGAAFAYLRECLEKQGVFVLLIGDLGSHHSKISSASFRGYAIADPIAPFIVINDNDARAAWSFTALHEAAHVWLGQTGISGASHDARVERFCNDVAGHLLLPPAELDLLSGLLAANFDNVLARISEFANKRNVSRRMIAYQMLRHNVIAPFLYERLCEHFIADWQRSKEKDPDQARDGRGVSRYVVLRHRLGPAMVNLARRSVDGGALSPTTASRLLGVSPGSVHALLHPARRAE